MPQHPHDSLEKRLWKAGRPGVLGWLIIVFLALLCVNIFSSNQPPEILEETPESSLAESAAPEERQTSAPASGRLNGVATLVFEDGQHVALVYFDENEFSPQELTVDRGDVVRFINKSNLTMRVGSRPENVSSPIYSTIAQPRAGGKGSTFEFTFIEPGIWAYENLTSSPPAEGVIYVR